MYSKNVNATLCIVPAAVKCFFLRIQKMILLTDIFRLHCKTVFQTDFFRNKFRCTNNLFGPPPCRLRYFSIDKRKTLWRHKYPTATGMGGPAVPWRANAGVGWKGKMKLRFVKFLTSRENEIEKKEEGGGLKLQRPLSPSQAAAESMLPSSSRHHSHYLSLHPLSQPTSSSAQLALRHGTEEQCLPAIPAPAVLLSLLSS